MPDVVPCSITGPVGYLEEVVLHWRLVYGYCRGEETQAQDDCQAYARLDGNLKSPHHRNGDEGEEQIGGDID